MTNRPELKLTNWENFNRVSEAKFMINLSATVKWESGLRLGKCEISTESGTLKKVPYTFGGRFEHDPGTNPEELITAAHAAFI